MKTIKTGGRRIKQPNFFNLITHFIGDIEIEKIIATLIISISHFIQVPAGFLDVSYGDGNN